jgi:hypothetical protein
VQNHNHGYREVEMAGFNELLGTRSIACRSGDGQFKKLINSIKEFYSAVAMKP